MGEKVNVNADFMIYILEQSKLSGKQDGAIDLAIEWIQEMDWSNATLDKCREVLEQERSFGIRIASRAEELLGVIRDELGRREADKELGRD
jgi:hypothetical protein